MNLGCLFAKNLGCLYKLVWAYAYVHLWAPQVYSLRFGLSIQPCFNIHNKR
jgi:hypothetical protein